MTDTTQNTGSITMDDVRAAIGDTDPSTTNASKLRVMLGRGSFATIQKHLDAIRAERAPAAMVAPGAAPAAPADAIAVMWGAAWAQAQALTLGRLETITAERDSLAALANTQASDLAALASAIDANSETVTAALADKQKLEGDLLAIIKSSGEALDGHKGEIARLTAELEKVQTAAAAASALAQRDAQIAQASTQIMVNRLTDQIGELKALLHKQSPVAVAKPAKS